MTHSISEKRAPKSPMMLGMAMFTMVPSRSSMNSPTASTANTYHRRRLERISSIKEPSNTYSSPLNTDTILRSPSTK